MEEQQKVVQQPQKYAKFDPDTTKYLINNFGSRFYRARGFEAKEAVLQEIVDHFKSLGKHCTTRCIGNKFICLRRNYTRNRINLMTFSKYEVRSSTFTEMDKIFGSVEVRKRKRTSGETKPKELSDWNGSELEPEIEITEMDVEDPTG